MMLSFRSVMFPPLVMIHHVISGGSSGQGKGAEHVRLASFPSLRRGTFIMGLSANRGTQCNNQRKQPCIYSATSCNNLELHISIPTCYVML